MVVLVRGPGHRGWRRLRQAGRNARNLLAAGLGPVLTAGGMALPPAAAAATVAGVTAAVVAAGASASAKAAVTGQVLVLLQNGESSPAPETTLLRSAGYTVDEATPAQWQQDSLATFKGYAALVIGDPSSGGSCSSLTPTAGSSGTEPIGTTWQQAVSGNVAVVGTAPVAAGSSAADTLVTDAVNYAAAKYSSGSGTGLYVSLNCEYSTASAKTDVQFLDGVEGIGKAGGLTVQGSLSCSDAGSVNKWEAGAAGTFGGFASGSLGTGSWQSPGCPVLEAFDTWPAIFTPLAYDAAPDATANFTASNGTTGQPYMLLGSPVSAATAALAPSSGGEVLAGTTTGGTTNPAARGVSQGSAGDPVNTENGDFTQSATDVTIPGFGPSLDFARTYDAQLAQQQTRGGTPGPLGYGWTDNWATSLKAGEPVPGDIYTLDGLATNTGNGGVPTSAPLDQPGAALIRGADVYIADTQENRIEEIPGENGSQWGIAMTAGHIYTIAGSDTAAWGDSADGTPARQALLYSPGGVAMDSAGNLYVADTVNNRVLEIPAVTGTYWGRAMTADDIYTVAGSASGNLGTSGDGGPAASALLYSPEGLAFDSAGDLYIADETNDRVQEVAATTHAQWGQPMTADDIYTVAGSATGDGGSSGDGGPAASALLNWPYGVAVDSTGNLYIADMFNNRVQEVAAGSGTRWGQSMTAGDIYTVAGDPSGASPGTSGDGGPAQAAFLDLPEGVAVDSSGDLYIADTYNDRVQEAAAGSGTQWGQSMTAGDIYTVAGSASGDSGSSGDGGPAASALLYQPGGVAVGSNSLYIADTSNNRVRQVSSGTADITTIAGYGGTLANAGDSGPATTAALQAPWSAATDGQGDILVTDSGNNRIQEIAASDHTQWGIAMTAGNVYTVAGLPDGGSGELGDGGPATSASLNNPNGIAVDSSGNLYIADSSDNLIREVAASDHTQWGIAMTAGDIYTVAGCYGGWGTSGDGGTATSGCLTSPNGVAVDSSGNLYIADSSNNRVQEVPVASGTQWGQPMTAGDIYTVAGSASGASGSSGDGGPATSALLGNPADVAVDGTGDLYIAEYGNNRVQEVPVASGRQWAQSMTAGDIYTVAGSASGASGSSGDGGPATSALLDYPRGITVGHAGDLYIADSVNARIQEVAAANGTQWAQSMTAGDIYTVAGSASGVSGSAGDGGPATAAFLDGPADVAVDPAGDLYITDSGDNLLREVAPTTNPAFPVSPLTTSPQQGAITVSQTTGAQVDFYPQSSGNCASPYRKAGSYCVLPQFTGATLTDNTSNDTYTFKSSAGANSYTYSSSGQLTSIIDPSGDTLTVTSNSPSPGSGNCPATAVSCNTITAASGRTLVIGSNSSGLITSVSDPMDRTWTYGYNSGSQLVTAKSPMGNVTSYTYGQGSTGNPLLANDLLTITSPNAQPGGPDAGDVTVNVYDATGRVTSQTDPAGLKTTFNYCVNAAVGNCMNPATGTGYTTITGPDGNKTVDDYSQGTLTAGTKLTGGAVTSEQDYVPDTTTGTLLDAATTDGNGNTTSYTYDSAQNLTSMTDPGGNTTTRQSTALNMASCDATAGSTTPCTASQAGPAPVAPGGVITPPSSAPPAGVTYSLYDTSGDVLYTDEGVYQPGSSAASYQQVDYSLYKGNSVTLNGTTITCTYTPPSPLLACATINPDGVVTQMQYDSAGDLTLSATPDGNGSELATTTYGYNADGEQTTKVSPDGKLSGANAANYTTVTAYNNDGQKTSVTQAGGSGATVTPRVTNYGYDPSGNQTTVQDARGYTTTTSYNADDKATLVKDPLGNATLTCYDGDGNATQTVPATGVTASNLTPASCPTAYPAGYGNRLASDATTYTYDAAGHKTAMTTPAPAGQSGSETTTYTYDAAGNLIKTDAPPSSNASGAPDNVTYDTYDSNNQLTSQTTGYGTSTAATASYCYGPAGNKTAVVYGDGNTGGIAPCETSYPWVVSSASNPTQAAYQTTYAYDSAGEQVSTTTPATAAAPSGATTTTAYDPAGNKLTTKDPDGVTTTYTYTPAGQKATVTYSGSSAHSVSYKYDADGFKTGMTDASGSSIYTPDPFGELATAQNGNGQIVSYSYDLDGNIATITYPLPSAATWATTNIVTYGYNNADQLTSVTDFTGNKITITPNADGQQKSETLGSAGDTITTSYDNTGTGIASETLSNSAPSTLQSFTYGYALDGTVLTETDSPSSSGISKTYSYDAQGRIVSETGGSLSASYGFDPSGNLASIPGGAAGAYDHNGELTSSAQSGVTTNYAYNPDGERTGATQSGSTIASATWNGAGQLTTYSNSAGNMTSATYDGDGLRASSTTASGTQSYVWNTVPQVPQLLADSGNAYIYTTGTTPAEQVNLSSGTVTYLVADSLGSVRGTVNSSGSLTGTATYDAWGNPLTSGGLTATTPFGYAGSYTDTTGLDYLVNRYYDPTTGQFTSVDPRVDTTGQAYAYASGNPVSIKDPSGETGCSIGHWDLFGFQIGPFPLGVPQGTLIQCVDGPGLYIRWTSAGFYHTPITRYCPWHWHYELMAYWNGALRWYSNKGGATGPTCSNNINWGSSTLLGGTRWTFDMWFPTIGTFHTRLWAWNSYERYYTVADTYLTVHT